MAVAETEPSARGETRFDRPRGFVPLWVGVLLPAAAFFLNLQVAYALVPVACRDGEVWVHLANLVSLALAAAGGWLSFTHWRELGRDWPTEGAGTLPRSRFLAIVGMVLGAFFALIILAQWAGTVILGPCQLS